MTAGPKSWAVVVPVKRLDVAKTRLAVAPELRRQLALAMALDTVTACVAASSVEAVLVVTDDATAAERLRAVGADVVADEPDAGLNPALSHGARVLARRHPGCGIAAVSSDLPALSPAALDGLLATAAVVDLGCVADAAGTGTTVLAARDAASFRPSFGAGSLRQHLDDAAADLTADADARLRRDVDTVEDLAGAVALGCGAATTRLLAAHPEWDRAGLLQ
jgi:2-phospho-L-lactate guanylyltransferase